MAVGQRIEMLVSDPRGLRDLRDAIRRLASCAQVAADDVVLAASEIVTNALLYVDGPCLFRGWLVGTAIRIEVSDRSALHLPSVTKAMPTAHGGHGLSIVDKVVSRWDVQIHDGLGKTVWFEIDGVPA